MSSDLRGPGGYQPPRIFLRSTNNGLPHPYALQPKLTVDFGLSEEDSATFRFSTAHIMNNILLVKFTDLSPGYNPHTSEIWIWNWVSGTVLGKIVRYGSYCQLCFLDDQHLLVFETTEMKVSLAIYAIPSLHPGSYRLEALAELDPMLLPTIVFQFPALHGSQKFFDGLCRLESGGTRSCVLRAGSTALSRTQVSTISLRMRLAERKHCLCGRHGDGSMEFRIFISVSKLLSIMGQNMKSGTTELAWEDWGETSTRWFTSDISQSARFRSYRIEMPRLSGSRYLTTVTLPHYETEEAGDGGIPENSRASCFLSVLDFHTPIVNRFANRVSDAYFNPPQSAANDEIIDSEHAIKEAGRVPEVALKEWLASSELDGQRKRIYTKTVGSDTPTVIKNGFAEPVVSRLPYRVVTRLSPVLGYKYWLMDGNNIIGSNSGAFGNGSIYTVGPASASQEVTNAELGGGAL